MKPLTINLPINSPFFEIMRDAAFSHKVLEKSDFGVLWPYNNCIVESIEYNRDSPYVTFSIRKVKMPKQKRYRLVIPENVPKVYMKGFSDLYLFDGKEVEFICALKDTVNKKVRFTFCGKDYDVRESWLVKIEESRPCTSEEYADACESILPSLHTKDNRMVRIESFDAGVEANEVKHRETETFAEFIEKDSVIKPDTPNYIGHEYTWNRALKSRGYE